MIHTQFPRIGNQKVLFCADKSIPNLYFAYLLKIPQRYHAPAESNTLSVC